MPSALDRVLLAMHVDFGADEAIGTAPVDRLAALSAPAPMVAASTRAAAGSAAEVAAACQTIDDLVAAIGAFAGCGLRRTATHAVVYDGNPAARVMLVGEAPGAEEDRLGKPFVGPAGKLLDRMLAAIGLDRGAVYITNTIFWRPPGNRTPTPEETAQCLPFVERQIALIAPRVLVFVGASAAKALLGRAEGITRLRGRWLSYQASGLNAPIDAMATFHPAYLLRQPSHKREVWRDLLAIRAKLETA